MRAVGFGTALLLVLLTACDRGDTAADAALPEALTLDEAFPEQERVAAVPIESIPMPEQPAPRRNFLVVRSAGGEQDLNGEWEPRAATCDDPAVLQILAEQPGYGVLLLFQLPAGDRTGVYPITFAESGAPEPPAAQIGVQLVREGRAFAYQGAQGEVELTAFESRVSGRLTVMLREITTEERIRLVGVFEEIGLETLPEAQCEVMKDALFPTDSTDTEEPQ